MLTKKELADKMKVCTRTIDRLMVKGLPCVRIGTSVRFEFDEVMKWLKSGKGE